MPAEVEIRQAVRRLLAASRSHGATVEIRADDLSLVLALLQTALPFVVQAQKTIAPPPHLHPAQR